MLVSPVLKKVAFYSEHDRHGMHVLKALSLPMFRLEGPNPDVTADLKVSETLCSYLVPGSCKKPL